MKFVELKVRQCSLAEEAKVIRRLERKLRKKQRAVGDQHWHSRLSIKEHRKTVVRQAARCTHLARGYLSGRPYREIEQKVRPGNEPDWNEVGRLVERYGKGAPSNRDELKAWREAA